MFDSTGYFLAQNGPLGVTTHDNEHDRSTYSNRAGE